MSAESEPVDTNNFVVIDDSVQLHRMWGPWILCTGPAASCVEVMKQLVPVAGSSIAEFSSPDCPDTAGPGRSWYMIHNAGSTPKDAEVRFMYEMFSQWIAPPLPDTPRFHPQSYCSETAAACGEEMTQRVVVSELASVAAKTKH